MDVSIIEIKNAASAALEIKRIGADPYSIQIMAPKASGVAVKLGLPADGYRQAAQNNTFEALSAALRTCRLKRKDRYRSF